MMRRIWIALALLLSSSPAFALIGQKNVDDEMKIRRWCMTNLYPAANNSPGSIVGEEGLIFQTSLDGLCTTDGCVELSATSTIPNFAWPARISAWTVDGGSATTAALDCQNLNITGQDVQGRWFRETISTVSETIATTNRVFAKVAKITVDCDDDGSADSSDVIQVFADFRYPGLPFDVRSHKDVVSLCVHDSSDSDLVKCTYSEVTSSSVDLESKVNTRYDYIDLSGLRIGALGGSETPAVNDDVCITVRPSHR